MESQKPVKEERAVIIKETRRVLRATKPKKTNGLKLAT